MTASKTYDMSQRVKKSKEQLQQQQAHSQAQKEEAHSKQEQKHKFITEEIVKKYFNKHNEETKEKITHDILELLKSPATFVPSIETTQKIPGINIDHKSSIINYQLSIINHHQSTIINNCHPSSIITIINQSIINY